jgi:5-methylcytosine-specific restriction endonuclease McrA
MEREVTVEADVWQPRVYKPKSPGLSREEWRLLRKVVYERDGYTCQRCDKQSRSGQGISPHHIIPRSENGLDHPDNLITLCNGCHDLAEESGYRTREEIVNILVSVEEENKVIEAKQIDEELDWHTWVYGGQRRPNPRQTVL